MYETRIHKSQKHVHYGIQSLYQSIGSRWRWFMEANKSCPRHLQKRKKRIKWGDWWRQILLPLSVNLLIRKQSLVHCCTIHWKHQVFCCCKMRVSPPPQKKQQQWRSWKFLSVEKVERRILPFFLSTQMWKWCGLRILANNCCWQPDAKFAQHPDERTQQRQHRLVAHFLFPSFLSCLSRLCPTRTGHPCLCMFFWMKGPHSIGFVPGKRFMDSVTEHDEFGHRDRISIHVHFSPCVALSGGALSDATGQLSLCVYVRTCVVLGCHLWWGWGWSSPWRASSMRGGPSPWVGAPTVPYGLTTLLLVFSFLKARTHICCQCPLSGCAWCLYPVFCCLMFVSSVLLCGQVSLTLSPCCAR